MEALAEHHRRAVGDFVGRTSFPIIGRDGLDRRPWATRGTGAWFRVPQSSGQDRLFLLTAAHVVLNSVGKLASDLFIPVSRPDGSAGVETVLLIDAGVATFVKPHDRAVVDLGHMDSVVVEVSRSIAARVLAGDWEILTASSFGSMAVSAESADHAYMLCGYPDQLSRSGIAWSASTPFPVLVARYNGQVSALEGLDPRVDLILERPDRRLGTDEPLSPLGLGGMSGALVWATLGQASAGIWSPRQAVVIAGHQVSATRSGYMRARRGAALAKLLQKAAPEIADEIEARLEDKVVD